MTLISFVDICRSFGGHTVFEPVTGIIRAGDRIGVVGPNGAGKTTFCRILAGLDAPDSGQVHSDKNLSLRYMEQEISTSSGRGVLEELIASAGEVRELEHRIAEFQARLERGETPDEDELHRYGSMLERFERLEGYSLRARAEKILVGLGLGEETFTQRVDSLSGGQRSRLALARCLLAEPDILFLDEPTNHLDLRAIEFLEGFLAETRSTVVVISHDRAFLNNVTTRTIEILDRKVTLYNGNYDAYAEWAAAEAERAERTLANYERKVEKLEDYIRRNIYGQKSRQAQSRRKMLNRMEPPPDVRRGRSAPRWEIQVADQSGSLVLEAKGLVKSWDGREPVFDGLDLTLMRGDSLAVIGDNGTGKSTLLQVLAGKLAPDAGRLNWGKDVSLACLPQHVERPADNRRVLDYMSAHAPDLTLGQLRGYLARFLFRGEQVEQSVSSLSEGEFRRLVLAGLIYSRANLLLLDEPTNHLDIYSREALQEALAEFPGTLVMITHDRGLLAGLATRILEFVSGARTGGGGDKTVEYDGDYSYYKLKRDEMEKALSGAVPAATKPQTAQRQQEPPKQELASSRPALSKNALQKIRERRDKLENEIAALEDSRKDLERRLSDPETYRQDGLATRLVAEMDTIREAIDKAYGEWEQLLEHD